MTAAATPLARVTAERPRVPLRPAEGWLTTLLLLAMPVLLAVAVDGAHWVDGQGRLTDFLPLAAVGGFAAGMYGAKAGWRRITIHLVGAAFAALIVPLLVGGELFPPFADVSLSQRYVATASSTVDAWIDLVVLGRAVTPQFGHFLLVLGLLMWATGQFVAVAAFRHRRPLAAAAAVGIVLVVNLAVNPEDQLWFLVLFSVLALAVLIRFHALAEHAEWIRRRIGDPAPAESMYVRGGSVFVAAAVGGALLLTGSASSAPLASVWGGADQWLIETGRSLQRFFPFVQNVRGPVGVVFGPSAAIGPRWITDSDVAVTVKVPAGDTAKYYWQVVAYDRFDGTSWSWSDQSTTDVAPDQPPLDGTLDQPNPTGRREVSVDVAPAKFSGSQVLAPGIPTSVSDATRLTTIGQAGFFAGLDTRQGDVPYRVSALVPVLGDGDPKGLTANRLRAAGQEYPAEVTAKYLGVPPNAIGPEARALLTGIEFGLGRNNTPYDLAKAVVDVLHSSKFTYSPDVSNIDCGALGIVECFAHYKTGYCLYYATTMAMLLRADGIPTRLVEGFLPGDRDPSGVETVRDSNSHAWVEVYFPTYGWVAFDPTGGNLAQLPEVPLGSPVPTATPKPSGSAFGSLDPGEQHRSLPPLTGGGSTTDSGSSGPNGATVLVVTILLAGALALLGLVTYRRGPRDVNPDTAYRGIVRLAARFGFGPRPTQTVYEYAASLGDVLPFARPELETVARAKVEVAYARRQPAPEALRALRDAVGRLRIALFRLPFHRRERRTFRRP
jgi:transglutaminase-like putative cysteine protease